MSRVVVAGGSGSLGRALVGDLVARGSDVVVLTRRPDPRWSVRQEVWDGRIVGRWGSLLEPPDDGAHPVSVVNLAGRLVDVRPTAVNVASLRSSRVDATRALVEASRAAHRPVDRWVQMSTTAIWSDGGERRITETTPLPDPGLPQMTGVAEPWEGAVTGAHAEHVVTLRTSLVLQSGAPVVERLRLLTRLGLGGKVGTGRQWVSWIHVDDWLALVRGALGLGDPDEPPLPDGVLVASAPTPVRNVELMATLRAVTGRRVGLPTPAPVARLGSWLLRSDPALGLTGRHCTSEVLAGLGRRFRYPTLEPALRDVVGRS
ncbi:TIGR01777 family oxidoreductase [Luteimicrobium xylanilyticum]|uniref:Epimerase family protein n=1 Tax=Luteimicrobium xylanilyticum TaxID=1133546 RepID=A0A5P9Q5H5_9MICO|nr:NAD-dependent epimerase/dehydratase family protein [Luteimicrobium xylanilyticum]QFU96621.1 Epimerase family protein [Luteimicrobium xylanilyticum]